MLVDDEPNNLESLAFLLQNDCAGVQIAYKATSAAEARNYLKNYDVDALFLDINMPVESGFDLLNSLTKRDFKLVFVTAHDEYALKAIKASAIDYIMKPVDIDELKATVNKIALTLNYPPGMAHESLLLEQLLNNIQKKTPLRIALPHLGGISFIEVTEIVSLQADSNYTIIHLKSMQKLVVSKTLKEFEELLDPDQFARIHKSYIVNLSYIKEYSTNDGGIVKMTDGNQWSISRRQVDLFLSKMKHTSLMFGK